MVERDVVLAKVGSIDRCLRRIAEARDPDRGLRSQDAEDIQELNLQRAVQAAIDLATHVVATEGYGIPGTLAETFTLLERQEILGRDLAERLRRMTGFRNIAVHEYTSIDPEVVQAILDHHLDDLRELSRIVLSRFGIDSGA